MKKRNVLVTLLILIATALFIISSFSLNKKSIIATTIVYAITALILLYAYSRTNKQTKTPNKDQIMTKIKKEIEKPAEEPTEDVEKKEESKLIGSSKNKKYHLRSCRFAKNIKKDSIVEGNDKKAFRGYTACKTCKPNKK